jgi:hypothetical protein
VRSGETSIDVFAMGGNSELLHWQFRDGAWVTHAPVVKAEADAEAEPEPAAGTDAAQGVIPPIRVTRYWESLGGVLTSAPDAVLFGGLDDELLVFARGTDHALWSRARQSTTWTGWTSLGHLLASAPHAAVVQKETFAVVALGIDSAIWYTMGGEWHSLGGTFSSPPYAVAWGRYLDVFATDSHGALNLRRWDGNGWTDWQNLGGILMTPPIADAPPDGLPYVFTLGTDSGVWRRRSEGGAEWTEWESLGTGLLTLPATVVRSPSQLEGVRALAALGFDHQVWFQEDDF